jgi:hypothetical protein
VTDQSGFVFTDRHARQPAMLGDGGEFAKMRLSDVNASTMRTEHSWL